MSEIKYVDVEHGQVFIYYKKKEEALKAFEIMNMGKKYHVEIDSQSVKKNETAEGIKSEEEESFIYLQIPSKINGPRDILQFKYMSHQLFGHRKDWDPKARNFVFSRLNTSIQHA